MLSCPNINSKQWKALVSAIGVSASWEVFASRGVIPLVANSAEEVLRAHKLITPEGLPIIKGVDLKSRIETNYINVRATSNPIGSKQSNQFITEVELISLESRAFYDSIIEGEQQRRDNLISGGNARELNKLDSVGKIVTGVNKSINNLSSEVMSGFELTMHKLYGDGLLAEPNEKLEQGLKGFLKKLSPELRVEAVDEIYSEDGTKINAMGVLRITQKLIEVSRSRDLSTLPEEAFHFITLLMDPDSTRMQSMLRDVVNFDRYAEVKRDYKEQYGDNEQLYRLEAIGKVLADLYIREVLPEKKFTPSTILTTTRDFSKWVTNKVLKHLSFSSESDLAGMAGDYMASFTEVVRAVSTWDVHTLTGESQLTSEQVNARLEKSVRSYYGAEAAAQLAGYNTSRSGDKVEDAKITEDLTNELKKSREIISNLNKIIRSSGLPKVHPIRKKLKDALENQARLESDLTKDINKINEAISAIDIYEEGVLKVLEKNGDIEQVNKLTHSFNMVLNKEVSGTIKAYRTTKDKDGKSTIVYKIESTLTPDIYLDLRKKVAYFREHAKDINSTIKNEKEEKNIVALTKVAESYTNIADKIEETISSIKEVYTKITPTYESLRQDTINVLVENSDKDKAFDVLKEIIAYEVGKSIKDFFINQQIITIPKDSPSEAALMEEILEEFKRDILSTLGMTGITYSFLDNLTNKQGYLLYSIDSGLLSSFGDKLYKITQGQVVNQSISYNKLEKTKIKETVKLFISVVSNMIDSLNKDENMSPNTPLVDLSENTLNILLEQALVPYNDINLNNSRTGKSIQQTIKNFFDYTVNLKRYANSSIGDTLSGMVATAINESKEAENRVNADLGNLYAKREILYNLGENFKSVDNLGDLITNLIEHGINTTVSYAKGTVVPSAPTMIHSSEQGSKISLGTIQDARNLHEKNWEKTAIRSIISDARMDDIPIVTIPNNPKVIAALKDVLFKKEYTEAVKITEKGITLELALITSTINVSEGPAIEMFKLKMDTPKVDPEKLPKVPVTQKEVVERIRTNNKTFAYTDTTDPISNVSSGYYVNLLTGEKVKYRASSYSKWYTRVGKSKGSADRHEASINQLITAEIGTELHLTAETAMGYYAKKNYKNITIENASKYKSFPVKPKWMTQEQFKMILKDSRDRLSTLSKMQTALDSKGKLHLMLEQMLYDGADVAGTLDLLAVLSNSKVIIHDIKSSHTFNNVHEEVLTGERTLIVNERAIRGMRDKHTNQMDVYKYLAKMVTGVTETMFEQTRIVPMSFNLKRSRFKNEDGSKAIRGDKKIRAFEKSLTHFAVGTPATRHIPISRERTRINALDKMLIRLEAQRESMIKQLERSMGSKQRESLHTKLYKLGEMTDLIVLAKGVGDLAPMVNDIVGYITDNIDKMPQKKLHQYHTEMETYMYVTSASLAFLPEAKNTKLITEQEYNKYLAELSLAKQLVINAQTIIYDKIFVELSNEYEDLGNTVDPFNRISGGSILGKIRPFSEYDHPVFTAFGREVEVSLLKTQRKDTKLDLEITKWHSKLRAYGKSSGTGSLYNVYKKLMDQDRLKQGNPTLVSMYDKNKFSKVIQEAENKGDYGTIQNFYEYNEKGKKEYKKARKEYITYLKTDAKLNSSTYRSRLANWQKKNDLSQPDAWLNKFARYRFATVKNPTKYFSREYSVIASDPVLREFYNWYTATMREWNMSMDTRIDARFVPRMIKDWVDILAQDVFNNTNMSSAYSQVKAHVKKFKGYEVENGSITIDDTDVTGMNSVPLAYRNGHHIYSSILGKNEVDLHENEDENNGVGEQLNIDLLYTMQMFGHAVHSKIAKDEIIDTLLSLRIVLQNTSTYKLDKRGRRIKDSSGDFVIENELDQKALEAFDDFYRRIINNQRDSNPGTTFNIGKKQMNTNDIINNISKLTIIKGLTLNWKGSSASKIAAAIQLKLVANKGIHLTNDTLKKVRKMQNSISKDQRLKLTLIGKYFAIDTGNLSARKASRNSASILTKYITEDLFYILFEKADIGPSNKLVVALTMEYGIDPNNPNKVENLRDLPKGTKSLFDSFIVDTKNKTAEINGINDKALAEFRGLSKALLRKMKGSANMENATLASMTPMGRAVLTFRSWFYSLYAERYGDTVYNSELKTVEIGKYRVLLSELFKSAQKETKYGLLKTTGGAMWMLARIALGTPGLFNSNLRKSLYLKQNEELANRAYKEFIAKYPEKEKYITKAQFVALRAGQFAAVQGGMQATMIVIAIYAILKADWDDDDIPLYKENPFLRAIVYPIVRRVYAENSFFFSPTSFQELIKTPIPAISTINSVYKVLENGVEEVIIDPLLGNKPDKTPLGHYSFGLLPGPKNLIQLGYGLNEDIYDTFSGLVEYEK